VPERRAVGGVCEGGLCKGGVCEGGVWRGVLEGGVRVLACAMEAEASGVGSMNEKTSSMGRPRSARTISRMRSKGTLGVRSRQPWNSST